MWAESGRELLIIGKHSKDLPSLAEVNFPDPDPIHKPGRGGGLNKLISLEVKNILTSFKGFAL